MWRSRALALMLAVAAGWLLVGPRGVVSTSLHRAPNPPVSGAVTGTPLPVVDRRRGDHAVAAATGDTITGRGGDAGVALTFDADMTPYMLAELRAHAVSSWYNADVVRILDSEHVPATLFLTGLWAETYPDVARRLAADPLFEIGNHTYDHSAFKVPCYGLPAAGDRRDEILHAQAVIRSLTGVQPLLLRFPGDCFGPQDVALAASLGLTVVSGTVPGWDAFNNDPGSIARHVVAAIRPGSIITLHLQGGNTAPSTAAALLPIIQAIRRRGLRLVTVSELIGALRADWRPAEDSNPGPTA